MLDVHYDTPKGTLQSLTAQPLARYTKFLSPDLIPTFMQMQDTSALSPMGSVSMFRLYKEPLDEGSAPIHAYRKMQGLNGYFEFIQQFSMDVPSEFLHGQMQSSEYLFLLSNTVQDSFLEPLSARVQELALLALEEDGQCALSQESLIGFWRFFFLHRSKIASRPQLVLTMEGNLKAIWEKDHNHRIAVRFMDDASVSYVTFFPDQFRPTQICRKGGNSSIEGFFENTGITRISH